MKMQKESTSLLDELFALVSIENSEFGTLTEDQATRYMELVHELKERNEEIPFGIEY